MVKEQDLAGEGYNHVKARRMGIGVNREYLETFKAFWTDSYLSKYSDEKYTSFNKNFKVGASLGYWPADEGDYKGMVLYNSSAAYGGTIFWKATPVFKINGSNLNSNYDKIWGGKKVL